MESSMLEIMSEQMIREAAEGILFRFELPLKTLLQEPWSLLDASFKGAARSEPLGVMIRVCTKDKATVLNRAITEVLTRLEREHIITDHDRIRELHAARISSFEETCEIFLYLADQTSNNLN